MAYSAPDNGRYFMIGTSYQRAVDAVARKLAYIDNAEHAWENYRHRAAVVIDSMPIAERVPEGARYKGYRSANGVVVGGPNDVLVDGDWLEARMEEKEEAEEALYALGELVGASKKDSLEAVVTRLQVVLQNKKKQ